jgi:Aldehyde dehydrogenase family
VEPSAGTSDGEDRPGARCGLEAGEALVAHPDVDKIAFTGSTPAGRKISGVRPLSSVVAGGPHSSRKWTALSLERIAAQLSRF